MYIKNFIICLVTIFFFGIYNIANAFEPVATQPQSVETQNNNSTPYIDALNNKQPDGKGFLTAFKKQQELDKQSYDTNTIAKEDAKRKIKQLNEFEYKHPMISGIDCFLKITEPYKIELNQQAEYGNKIPIDENNQKLLKQTIIGIYWATIVMAFILSVKYIKQYVASLTANKYSNNRNRSTKSAKLNSENYNNNPFSYKGKIKPLPCFVTGIVLNLFTIFFVSVLNVLFSEISFVIIFVVFVFVLTLFLLKKRIYDITDKEIKSWIYSSAYCGICILFSLFENAIILNLILLIVGIYIVCAPSKILKNN